MREPLVTERIIRLSKKINAVVLIEPEYNFVGHITFPNGKTTLFKNTSFNINSIGSVEVAKDKGYSSFFLKYFGFSVPDSITVFSNKLNSNLKIKRTIEDGEKFISSIGWPVIIKPNDKSKGEKVYKVYCPAEYNKFAKKILKENDVMQIQRFCIGNDYRIAVLDQNIISAYQRIPLSIIGDGKSTIKQLLEKKQCVFLIEGRDTMIDIKDDRISQNLRRNNLKLNSVILNGQIIQLLDNANLSTGGSAIDFTTSIHNDYKQLAIDITNKMCLRLCGVDIITNDITKPIDEYNIIEINAAPGLDNYAFIGADQNAIVDDLYFKILTSIEKENT